MPPDDDKLSAALDAQEGKVIDQEGNDARPDSGGKDGGDSRAVTTREPQQPATRSTTDSKSDPQHHTQGQAPAATQQPSKAPATDNGDLIEPGTGRVLARAGRERREWERQRAVERAVTPLQQQLQSVNSQLQTAQAEINAFRQAAALPTQLGLNPQDTATAMQFMAHWRRDPVGAAKNMLTELRAGGYNLDDLGSTVDAGAIRRMVMEAVAPFQQDRDAQRQVAEQQTAAQQEVNQLFTELPWTHGQQEELQVLLEADASLTLREAAYRLHVWAVENGYDIWQPLKAQHHAAQQGQPQQQPPRPSAARAPGPVAVAEGNIVPRHGSSVGHERTNRDIVRESLREAGFNV